MADIEKIVQMSKEGFSNKEIAEKVSTEDNKVSYQAVAKIVKENVVIVPELVESGIVVRTASEYEAYSKANGRSSMGGEIGVPQKATIEDLRSKINSRWTPSMFIEKWQMTEAMLMSLVHKLSKKELRDKPVICNFKNDFFR